MFPLYSEEHVAPSTTSELFGELPASKERFLDGLRAGRLSPGASAREGAREGGREGGRDLVADLPHLEHILLFPINLNYFWNPLEKSHPVVRLAERKHELRMRGFRLTPELGVEEIANSINDGPVKTEPGGRALKERATTRTSFYDVPSLHGAGFFQYAEIWMDGVPVMLTVEMQRYLQSFLADNRPYPQSQLLEDNADITWQGNLRHWESRTKEGSKFLTQGGGRQGEPHQGGTKGFEERPPAGGGTNGTEGAEGATSAQLVAEIDGIVHKQQTRRTELRNAGQQWRRQGNERWREVLKAHLRNAFDNVDKTAFARYNGLGVVRAWNSCFYGEEMGYRRGRG